jgi:hypothetical protein
MSDFLAAIEDGEHRVDFALAELVGRHLFGKALKSAGYSDTQVERALHLVVAEAGSFDISHAELAVDELDVFLRHMLDQAGTVEALRQYMKNALEALEAGDFALTGVGDVVTRATGYVVFGILAALLISKLEAGAEIHFPSGEAHFGVTPGIPTEFAPIAKTLAEILPPLLRGPSSLGQPDAGPPTSPSTTRQPPRSETPGHDTGKTPHAAKPTARIEPHASPAPTAAAVPDVHAVRAGTVEHVGLPAVIPSAASARPLKRGEPWCPRDTMSDTEAMKMAEQIVQFVPADAEFLRELETIPTNGGLFRKDVEGFSVEWPKKRQIILGASVVRRNNGARLAIRVQSPRPLTRNALKVLKEFFNQTIGPCCDVTWISPIRTLANRWDLPNNWKGPRRRRIPSGFWTPIEIGGPVNISGGTIGSFGLFLKTPGPVSGGPNINLGLTAGHVLYDTDGRAFQNRDLWVCSPPMPPGDEAMGLGHLYDGSTFSAADYERTAPYDEWAVDYGLINLEGGHYPIAESRTQFGVHRFATQKLDPRTLPPQTKFVMAAGRVSEARGTLVSATAVIDGEDSLRNRRFRARDLIEIALDSPGRIECGQSGGLICAEVGASLHPIAIVVAGSKVGDDMNGTRQQIVYALPITLIPGMSEMEIG